MRPIKALVGNRETVTVEPRMSVSTAARLMADEHIGAVPVLENGHLAGIFSERDVLTRVVAAGRDPNTTSVGDVMSTSLVTAEASESYDVCLDRMRTAHVRHLPVVHEGRLAGVLSLRDLLAADIDEKAQAITLLHAYVHEIPIDIANKLKS